MALPEAHFYHAVLLIRKICNLKKLVSPYLVSS